MKAYIAIFFGAITLLSGSISFAFSNTCSFSVINHSSTKLTATGATQKYYHFQKNIESGKKGFYGTYITSGTLKFDEKCSFIFNCKGGTGAHYGQTFLSFRNFSGTCKKASANSVLITN